MKPSAISMVPRKRNRDIGRLLPRLPTASSHGAQPPRTRGVEWRYRGKASIWICQRSNFVYRNRHLQGKRSWLRLSRRWITWRCRCDRFHWDSNGLDLDATNTWQGAFKHFRSKGEMRWTPSAAVAQNMIPAAARVEYDYSQDRRSVSVVHSEITTPDSRLEMDGFLGTRDSALEVKFQAGDLQRWDDFINSILGSVTTPKLVSGKVTWQGRILGPLAGPAFVGRLEATDARYDKLYWDKLDGDLEYSPDLFRLSNATATHGSTTANLSVELTLDGDWSFLPSSPWKLDARLNHSNSADLQSVLGTAYPMTGFVTGDFHGSGTRAEPRMDGNFVAEDIGVKDYVFDRLSGTLHVEHDEIGLSSADLRMGAGRVTGSVSYHHFSGAAGRIRSHGFGCRPRQNPSTPDPFSSNWRPDEFSSQGKRTCARSNGTRRFPDCKFKAGIGSGRQHRGRAKFRRAKRAPFLFVFAHPREGGRADDRGPGGRSACLRKIDRRSRWISIP